MSPPLLLIKSCNNTPLQKSKQFASLFFFTLSDILIEKKLKYKCMTIFNLLRKLGIAVEKSMGINE